MLSIVLSIIIALLSTFTLENKDNQKNNIGYAIKTFIISLLTIYFGLAFLTQDNQIPHEINTGEPPF